MIALAAHAYLLWFLSMSTLIGRAAQVQFLVKLQILVVVILCLIFVWTNVSLNYFIHLFIFTELNSSETAFKKIWP